MQNRRGKTGNATGRSSYFRNSFARIWCVRRCIIISEFLNPADCERTVFTKAFVGQIFQFFERWKWFLKQLQCFFKKKIRHDGPHRIFMRKKIVFHPFPSYSSFWANGFFSLKRRAKKQEEEEGYGCVRTVSHPRERICIASIPVLLRTYPQTNKKQDQHGK